MPAGPSLRQVEGHPACPPGAAARRRGGCPGVGGGGRAPLCPLLLQDRASRVLAAVSRASLSFCLRSWALGPASRGRWRPSDVTPPPPRLPFCLEPRGQLGPTLKPRALPAFAAAGSPSVKDISKVAFSGPRECKPRGGDREGRDVPVAAPCQHFRKSQQFFFFGEENLTLLKITERARV